MYIIWLVKYKGNFLNDPSRYTKYNLYIASVVHTWVGVDCQKAKGGNEQVSDDMLISLNITIREMHTFSNLVHSFTSPL